MNNQHLSPLNCCKMIFWPLWEQFFLIFLNILLFLEVSVINSFFHSGFLKNGLWISRLFDQVQCKSTVIWPSPSRNFDKNIINWNFPATNSGQNFVTRFPKNRWQGLEKFDFLSLIFLGFPRGFPWNLSLETFILTQEDFSGGFRLKGCVFNQNSHKSEAHFQKISFFCPENQISRQKFDFPGKRQQTSKN